MILPCFDVWQYHLQLNCMELTLLLIYEFFFPDSNEVQSSCIFHVDFKGSGSFLFSSLKVY